MQRSLVAGRCAFSICIVWLVQLVVPSTPPSPDWTTPRSQAQTQRGPPNFETSKPPGSGPPYSTLNPQPSTLNPQPSTLNPQPSTLNPQPSTLNPQPSTLNPQPSTLNPSLHAESPKPAIRGLFEARERRKTIRRRLLSLTERVEYLQKAPAWGGDVGGEVGVVWVEALGRSWMAGFRLSSGVALLDFGKSPGVSSFVVSVLLLQCFIPGVRGP